MCASAPAWRTAPTTCGAASTRSRRSRGEHDGELPPPAERKGGMDRVLLVACRTAAGPPLLEAVRRRAAQSPCQFTLLVPRPCHGLHGVVDPEDHGWREARDVIETARPGLGRAAGSGGGGLDRP